MKPGELKRTKIALVVCPEPNNPYETIRLKAGAVVNLDLCFGDVGVWRATSMDGYEVFVFESDLAQLSALEELALQSE